MEFFCYLWKWKIIATFIYKEVSLHYVPAPTSWKTWQPRFSSSKQPVCQKLLGKGGGKYEQLGGRGRIIDTRNRYIVVIQKSTIIPITHQYYPPPPTIIAINTVDIGLLQERVSFPRLLVLICLTNILFNILTKVLTKHGDHNSFILTCFCAGARRKGHFAYRRGSEDTAGDPSLWPMRKIHQMYRY